MNFTIERGGRRLLMQTLGTLGNSKSYGGYNWRILQRTIETRGHWKSITAAGQRLSFSEWIDKIKTIAETRNNAAHNASVNEREFEELISLYFGTPTQGIGGVATLLMAWQ